MTHPKDLTEAKERIRDLATQLTWAREAEARAKAEAARWRELYAIAAAALARIEAAAFGPHSNEAEASAIADEAVSALEARKARP